MLSFLFPTVIQFLSSHTEQACLSEQDIPWLLDKSTGSHRGCVVLSALGDSVWQSLNLLLTQFFSGTHRMPIHCAWPLEKVRVETALPA